ncbi:MAG: hypothetical protein MUE42_09575 [Opitutaceae bacterium]|jgi:hypothetical protein|nr:hypothetical protein [Opitutaceae bacterium]
MQTTQILLSALTALAAVGVSFAQSSALPGTKSTVTLTVTATTTHGAFLVKQSVIDNQENYEDRPPAVIYSEQQDPLDYAPANANDPSYYYTTKTTQRIRNFGTRDEPYELVMEEVTEYVTKLKTLRYSNVQFIQALIDAELVNITSPIGYSLVMVQPAQDIESEDEVTMLFFIERGSTIYYVGREGYTASSPRDALMLYTSDASADAINSRSRTAYSHRSTSEGIEEDSEGVTTFSSTVSGTDPVRIELFPSYFDAGTETYTSPDGMSLEFCGHLSYSGRFDTKNGLYVISSARVNNATGSYEVSSSGMEEFSDNQTGPATMSLSFAPSRVLADITPYLDAMPEELAELKAQIVASYSGSSSDPAMP